MAYVYHSSQIQGLTKIKPNKGVHGQNWVYAAKDKTMSTVFICGGNDFLHYIGREQLTKKVCICERAPGAFDFMYKNKSGSIYVLDRENFEEGKTQWNEELICPHEVDVVEEIKISDVVNYLYELENSGHIIIKKYPVKIYGIPENDEDLVKKAVRWTMQYGDEVLADIKRWHPHLLERVVLELKG